MLSGCEDENINPTLKFVECLCLHMDSRFTESDLLQWRIFEMSALVNTSNFNYGQAELGGLYFLDTRNFFKSYEDILPKLMDQYRNLRFVFAEKKMCVDADFPRGDSACNDSGTIQRHFHPVGYLGYISCIEC